jgi:hypothetical protein
MLTNYMGQVLDELLRESHYHVHKSPPLVPILMRQSTSIHPIPLRTILIFWHLCLSVSSDPFLLNFPLNSEYKLLPSQHHSVLCEYSNNQHGIQIVLHPIMEFSSDFSYLLYPEKSTFLSSQWVKLQHPKCKLY